MGKLFCFLLFLIFNAYNCLKSLYSNLPASSHTTPPSLLSIRPLSNDNPLTLTSMDIEHNFDMKWHMRSFHERFSQGWNTTTSNNLSPIACHIRFLGQAYYTHMTKKHNRAGYGYITVSYLVPSHKSKNLAQKIVGNQANISLRLHCYYTTAEGHGVEFMDTPRTIGFSSFNFK